MATAIAPELSVKPNHRIRIPESGGTAVVHLGSSQGHESRTLSSTGSGHPNSSNTIWCVVVSGVGPDHAIDSRYANPRSADHCVTIGQGIGVAAGHPLAAASAPKRFATGVVGLPFRLVARMATRRFAVAHAKKSRASTSRSGRKDRRMIASPRLASPRLASPRLASPRLASPRLAARRVASPRSQKTVGGVMLNGLCLTHGFQRRTLGIEAPQTTPASEKRRVTRRTRWLSRRHSAGRSDHGFLSRLSLTASPRAPSVRQSA